MIGNNSLSTIVSNPYRLLGTYRALLALLVLISHTNMWLPDWVGPLALGNVGVLSFFVLSGFVIAEACDVFYPGKPQRFLLNRFLRIYPTYWVTCGIAIAIYVWIPHPEFNANTGAIFANLTIILAERLPSNELRLLSLIWAVGIELRFYVLAALVDYADRFLNRQGILKPGTFMFLAGLTFLVLYFFAWTTGFNRFSVMKFAPFFVLGFAYYRLLRYRSKGSQLLVLFALLAAAHSYIEYNSAGANTLVASSTLIFAIGLVLFGGLACVTKVPKIIEKIDKRLGDLTYSIYLVHWPIVYAVTESDLLGYEAFATTVICTILISLLIFMVVERPLFVLRDSIRRIRLYS